jgi:hypothetical protein
VNVYANGFVHRQSFCINFRSFADKQYTLKIDLIMESNRKLTSTYSGTQDGN